MEDQKLQQAQRKDDIETIHATSENSQTESVDQSHTTISKLFFFLKGNKTFNLISFTLFKTISAKF